jgi:hypothetical protein
MYTETEFSGAGKALKRFILLFAAFALIMLGLMAYALIVRIDWLVYAAAGVLVAGLLFSWGNFGARLYCWNRFLKEMRRGLDREAEGVIASIDEDETTKEGLEFRALRLLTGESSDKAGGRLLYVDSSRFPLKVQPGERIRCRIYGNYIKEITAPGEE